MSPLALALAVTGLLPTPAHAARIQELVAVRGVRDNQLVGYGLVVGLNNTGDTGQSRFTVQSTAAMLRRLGATVDPRAIQTRNAAAVMVTATLGHDADAGMRIDVTVSSLGNARSLLGGTLVQTPLYGADREVYAVAQGAVIVGGYSASGRSGSSVNLNHVTAGRVPAGGIVEREVRMADLSGENIELSLHMPSFVTASRIVEAVNAHFGDEVAWAVDAGTIRLHVPPRLVGDPVRLLAQVELLQVQPDAPARVVIDERTGTVVLGTNVTISEVAIAQGGLSIEISETPAVSQPSALAGGDTVVVPQSDVRAEVRGGPIAHVPASATLADVVTALNAVGAGPRDLISIFQALRTAGALQAEIRLQ
ncbi:MAG: flagellar basal body P-ring protein FlgI [Deltaproteobacteria bacterium]|nr:flagellar basal body P-ring protein FlgI [Deltaproteobacteria bacterium]